MDRKPKTYTWTSSDNVRSHGRSAEVISGTPIKMDVRERCSIRLGQAVAAAAKLASPQLEQTSWWIRVASSVGVKLGQRRKPVSKYKRPWSKINAQRLKAGTLRGAQFSRRRRARLRREPLGQSRIIDKARQTSVVCCGVSSEGVARRAPGPRRIWRKDKARVDQSATLTVRECATRRARAHFGRPPRQSLVRWPRLRDAGVSHGETHLFQRLQTCSEAHIAGVKGKPNTQEATAALVRQQLALCEVALLCHPACQGRPLRTGSACDERYMNVPVLIAETK